MSRHDYPLRDETVRTLTGNCPKIADEMGVSATYVYGITEGTNPDPFAYFLAIYRAAVRAGVDTTEWDAKLASEKAAVRPSDALRDCLSRKLKEEAKTNSTLIDALADGAISEHEKKPMLRAIAVERNTLDIIESEIVNATVLDLRNQAKTQIRRKKESGLRVA